MSQGHLIPLLNLLKSAKQVIISNIISFSLATVQKPSFVVLGSGRCAQRCKKSRAWLLLVLTSPVDYTHSTIRSLKTVTREMTRCLISSLYVTVWTDKQQ